MRLHQLLAVVLFAAAAAAGAAEREVLTLTDGRTLVGVYDADAGTIALDGRGTSAVVKVRADQVKARELAPPLKSATAAVLAGEPAPPLPRSAQPAPHVDPVASGAATLAELHRIDDDASRARSAAYEAWAKSLNLRKLPEPVLGADPRKSEVDHLEQVRSMNSLIDAIENAKTNGHMAGILGAHDVLERIAGFQQLLAEKPDR